MFSNRRYVIGAIAVGIIVVYLIRLFTLQLLSDDYRKSADSNAFRRDVLYPSRGLILDRNDSLLVYNEPSYNILVTMNDQVGIDTVDFCESVGISREEYEAKCEQIKSQKGYSRFKPQLFMTQIPQEKFLLIREKLFRFRGFEVEKRTQRRYDLFAFHSLNSFT